MVRERPSQNFPLRNFSSLIGFSYGELGGTNRWPQKHREVCYRQYSALCEPQTSLKCSIREFRVEYLRRLGRKKYFILHLFAEQNAAAVHVSCEKFVERCFIILVRVLWHWESRRKGRSSQAREPWNFPGEVIWTNQAFATAREISPSMTSAIPRAVQSPATRLFTCLFIYLFFRNVPQKEGANTPENSENIPLVLFVLVFELFRTAAQKGAQAQCSHIKNNTLQDRAVFLSPLYFCLFLFAV